VKTSVPDPWVDLLHRLAPLLPADSFAQLRAFSTLTDLSEQGEQSLAACLGEAISALDSLYHTLTTFLPRYLLDLAPRPGQPHGELLEGSFIFADVTGFTALTGELSRRGTEGREEMNRLMRRLFAVLLDPLLASGGDLLIFAGDAVLGYFPAQSGGQDAQRATRTALRLIRAIAPFAHLRTRYGTFSLTMSAGVERGRAFAAAVGTRQRMELLISGGPVQGAMQAEGGAEPGQVFVGSGVLPYLREEDFVLQGNVVAGVQGKELDDYEAVLPARRRRRLSAVFSHRTPDLIEHLQDTLDQVEALVPFIPPDLFSQIARGEDICQHPPVAIQFVNLLGVEDLALGPAGPERATAALQRYFVQAHEIVADREGIISQVDPYAKGFTLLNPFGAPTHHEGVPRLAASAALELARALEQVNQEFKLEPPLTQRTGLTYDRIFTGKIGYRQRQEYVVAGPAVNLAARLMSKAAPGQIVLDRVAWEAVQEDFVADALPPISLKGIPEPVPRFALRGLSKGKGLHLTDYPLVGQQEERARLQQALEEAIVGRGSALALVGEAGAGKSRLATDMIDQANERGMAVLMGRCRPFAQTTPYFPWADVVCQWFDLDEELPAEVRRQRLRERLAEFDLTSSFPAFANLVGLPPIRLASRTDRTPAPQGGGLFAALQQQTERTQADQRNLTALLVKRTAQVESSQSENFVPDERPSIWEALRERVSVPQALHLLMERQACRKPTLVIIEDVQWMDPVSREVLDAIAAVLSTWSFLLLVTTRPETEWEGEAIQISPLSDSASTELAAFALRATRLEPNLAEWLIPRAGGQPLFILSYCRALRDADAVVVDPASSVACWNGPPPMLPVSLQELLLAQVDRLGREARDVMRCGAVIGATFPNWLLRRMCQNRFLPDDRVSEALERAARRSILAPPPPAPDHHFSTHSLQDAVYATLSHALRRAWHEQVGDHLAEADDETRYERLEQIAYHYSRGGEPCKAAHFTRLAGDKARTRQADETALAFYAQTLTVPRKQEVAADQRRAYEGVGDVYVLQGDEKAAYAAYQAALDGASAQETGHLRAKLALLAHTVGQPAQDAVERAQEALSHSDPIQPWLGAVLVWLNAEHDEGKAKALCQDLLTVAGEPVKTLLEDMLKDLGMNRSLLPYSDLIALFARSCLRLPPGEKP
jgi:class 3 adenylate cyclase